MAVKKNSTLAESILKLALCNGIGPVLIARLVRVMGIEQVGALRTYTADEIAQQCGVSMRQATLVLQSLADDAGYAQHQAWCEKEQVSPVFLFDPEYPSLLKECGAPPAVVWVKGAFPSGNRPWCALVGSRDANAYGQRVVKTIVPWLVSQNVVTVSGGARGIDTWVHRETIAAGGTTIAVLGGGLARLYPKENIRLFDDIIASGGALASPFPPLCEPVPGAFPARNKIIAGLSHGCIVVQAAAKSGALITAMHALEENREVGAVPGAIDDALAAGTNQLLLSGAHVVLDGPSAGLVCGVHAPNSASAQAAMTSECTDSLLQHLTQPCLLEDLVALTGYDMTTLYARLFELQCAGAIRQNHNGTWERL